MTPGPRTISAALSLALLSTALIHAQTPTERAATDSLSTLIAAVDSISELPDKSRCDRYSGSMDHLCRGFLAAKRAELSGDADAAIAAELEARQVVRSEPDWSAGWYLLGVARLALARAGVNAKPGPLQILGVSYEAGAGHALVRALELDSTNTNAVIALAMTPIPREGASQLGKRLAMLRRMRSQLDPAAMAGTARVERVAGSRDSAAVLWRRVLKSGVVDSGYVATELARDLFAAGNPETGAKVLFAGAATTTKSGRQAYRDQLALVAEPAEVAAWDTVPPSGRPAWLQQFWAGRDVHEGWPAGSRLVEHYRRIEYAMKNYTLQLPPSGRQLVASSTGGIDTRADEQLRKEATTRNLTEANADGPSEEGWLNFEVRMALSQMELQGLDGPFREFQTSLDILGDRGVVWIRYGKPTKALTSVGGKAMEAWKYDNLQPPLVLQFAEENFVGQIGATKLVPTLINEPGRFRDQFCGMIQSLCAVETGDPANPPRSTGRTPAQRFLTDNGRVTAAVIDRVVREGRQEIARATTTDANPRTFTKSITPLVQFYGLIAPDENRSVGLATFAVPGDQLEWTKPAAAGGRTVYTVRMVLALLDKDGHRTDVDSTRYFATPQPLAKGQYLTGTLAMPLASGNYQGSLLLSQPDGRGAVASLSAIRVPRPTGALELSSVVLGRVGGGEPWRSGSSTVPLNPLGAFTEKGKAELYFQVIGAKPGTEYATTLEFFEADKPDESALTLTFKEKAKQSFEAVARTIDLANLKPGRYRLRVNVSGGGTKASESTRLTIQKQ